MAYRRSTHLTFQQLHYIQRTLALQGCLSSTATGRYDLHTLQGRAISSESVCNNTRNFSVWKQSYQNKPHPLTRSTTQTLHQTCPFSIHCMKYSSENIPKTLIDDRINDTKKKRPRTEQIGEFLEDLTSRSKPPTTEEWTELGDDFSTIMRNSRQWPSALMRMLVGSCRHSEEGSQRGLSLGKSLLEHARQLDVTKNPTDNPRDSRITVSLLTSYMSICGHRLTFTRDTDLTLEDEIADIYKQVQLKTSVYDYDSSAAIVSALSSTRTLWRQALAVLGAARELYPLSRAHLVPVVTAAYRAGRRHVAAALLGDLAGVLRGESFTRVLDGAVVEAAVEAARRDGHSETVDGLLRIMQEHGWLLEEGSTGRVIDYYQSLPAEVWVGSRTSVTAAGVCRECRLPLEGESLTRDQFETLRDSFLQKCLRKEDIFLNTSPEELMRFQDFLKRQKPFDFVLDGLNIALMLSKKKKFQAPSKLRAVVEEFSRRGRVLVLGRKHMKSWSEEHMSRVRRAASIFYAENITKDDPFILYAALHSGPDTLVVTRDMLRDHRFLLPSELRDSFNVWQRTHQVTFTTETSGLRYVWPSRHETRVQWTQDGCHVPYDDQSERASHEMPNSWLCLRRGTRE